jgi:hypothetical protein
VAIVARQRSGARSMDSKGLTSLEILSLRSIRTSGNSRGSTLYLLIYKIKSKMKHIQLFENFGGKPEVDFTKIDNIEFDGVDTNDAPDFSNAFIMSCDIDGRPATEEELDIINDNSEFVYKALMDHLY